MMHNSQQLFIFLSRGKQPARLCFRNLNNPSPLFSLLLQLAERINERHFPANNLLSIARKCNGKKNLLTVEHHILLWITTTLQTITNLGFKSELAKLF